MIRTIVFGLAICLSFSYASAQSSSGFYTAQSESDWYCNGVHQFFRCDYADAINSLSIAISANPSDPRPYFFRGLAKLNCGGELSAVADFQQGAFREAYKSGRASSSVNRSLERIQGNCRLEIERFRREARLNYLMKGNMPAVDSPPVMFGDMVDVNSIAPIIDEVIPKNTTIPPGPAVEPENAQPQPDVQEAIPAEAVPRHDGRKELPKNGAENFAPPPPPVEQTDETDNDPFGT